jgi:hypothetical protein
MSQFSMFALIKHVFQIGNIIYSKRRVEAKKRKREGSKNHTKQFFSEERKNEGFQSN